MPSASSNVHDSANARWTQVFERLAEISSKVDVLNSEQIGTKSDLGSVAAAVTKLQEQRQVNWGLIATFVFSGGGFLAMLTGALFVILTMSAEQTAERIVRPIELKTAISTQDRDAIREQVNSNTARATALETRLEGFAQQTRMSLVEIESQFKNLGQYVNASRAQQERENCTLRGKPCPEIQYFPELGRTVTNGNGQH